MGCYNICLPGISWNGTIFGTVNGRLCSFDDLKLRLVEADDRVLVVKEGFVDVVRDED